MVELNNITLRFLNGGFLRNLNMYSSQKLYPVCSATWLNMKCVIEMRSRGDVVLPDRGQWEVPQQAPQQLTESPFKYLNHHWTEIY